MNRFALLTGALIAACMTPALAANPAALLHQGAAGAVVLAYALLCSTVWWRHRRTAVPSALPADGADLLLAHASQTGYASQLAAQTAQSLMQAGMRVAQCSFDQLSPTLLAQYRQALFIVSTTGEGDAPDAAASFVRQHLGASAALPAVRYGVLALGDSSYTQFCAFGHTLDGWLRHAGAQALFDLIEVDNGDAGALRHWQHQLGVLAGATEMADWTEPDYQCWTLSERTLLNPGSQGGPAYLLGLTSPDQHVRWQPGDIAEVGARNADEAVQAWMLAQGRPADEQLADGRLLSVALADRLLPHGKAECAALLLQPADALLAALPAIPHREYSIASLPEEGQLHLLVRQMQYPDGRLGLGSGWLTRHAQLGGEVAVRIRENRGFHPPPLHAPLILIGNGTGLAGLLAHLKLRVQAGQGDNWLLFGERQIAHDFYHAAQLRQWQQQGMLRLDCAFSRDEPGRYVQDALRAAAQDLLGWLERGAAIYVCGSAAGMAPAVHGVLHEVLGESALDALIEQGRYRRDVY
ncbi:sulfite reductase (NADPH) flavoprotein alpha-component [Andreprevotia lacus DSM 23236]|jgi:sulfite reductase (NADPH) flavoprotein alpha-component|uniref:NADPH--hemoprotein reductase n=1 Tax=Andreprevotia lacus DSM 23236 TaxID=1121001 RepID=A0A1W1X9Q7_9NEIS|nr:flavodoxin domain-containing protein [Andreprevotia lacus]SMC20593.1 sulfite reductase (NADPH) flavoprotein alpha-component [Andreprevotia lacus DSM 23236]